MNKLQLNPQRLKIARERRGFTKTELAKLLGITSRTLSNYESNIPEASGDKSIIEFERDTGNIEKLANILGYPTSFFTIEDELTEIKTDMVSFRSLSRLSAKKRDAALAVGSLAMEFENWLSQKFNLPKIDIPDFDYPDSIEPAIAARRLREYWGIGEKSISNMVHLLEAKGIRVYSLTQNCLEVDAYSYWLDNKAFIFLNNQKTPERSRFDAAHELGHLVLHRNISTNGEKSKEAEQEANQFASEFLMPERSVKAVVPYQPSLSQLIKLKANWNVSLAALVKRVGDLKLATEWHYRQLQIELGKRGFRTIEPDGLVKRETSIIIDKIVEHLKQKKINRKSIEEETKLPLSDLSEITFKHRYFNLRLL